MPITAHKSYYGFDVNNLRSLLHFSQLTSFAAFVKQRLESVRYNFVFRYTFGTYFPKLTSGTSLSVIVDSLVQLFQKSSAQSTAVVDHVGYTDLVNFKYTVYSYYHCYSSSRENIVKETDDESVKQHR